MSETAALAPARPALAGTIDLTAAITSAAALGKEGVEVLERLHAIAKDERAANARAAFVRAMAAFRAEMPHITRTVEGARKATRAGTRTKGLYAPLDTITRILDPIATKHGLSYRFDREVKDGRDFVVCIVGHVDGHEESSRFPAPSDDGAGRNAIQSIASGDTYAKRYSLISAFGITTADPDDDAQDFGRAPEANDGPPEAATEAQVANLGAVLDEAPDPAGERRRLLGYFSQKYGRKLAALGGLTALEADEVIRATDARRQRGWK